MIDPTTDKQIESIPPSWIAWDHVSFESASEEAPVNVQNSYKFECSFKDVDTTGIKELLESNQSYKDAYRLTDALNDLIEEYYAPGTPRRERRAIKREFDKVFRIFQKHCKTHGIDYKFVRTNG